MDPSDVRTVTVFWGAPVFSANRVYLVGEICRPTTDNGYYYTCTVSGKAPATEPASWGQKTQVVGTATFVATSFDLFVRPTESLSTSSWTATTGVTLSNEVKDSVATAVTVTITDPTIELFELTNHVVKTGGDARDKTFQYKVRQQ